MDNLNNTVNNAVNNVVNEVSQGVTSEAAAPTEEQLVQPDAQTADMAAQPKVDGQGTPETQESIPYERFQQMNEANKAREEMLQQQLLIAQQQNQIYQSSIPQPQSQSRIEEIASKLAEVGDDEGLYGKEAKEMVEAFREEMTSIKASQEQNLRTTFLAQNPDFQELVQKDTVLGPQFSPDFIQMLNENPASLQQLQSLANNPLMQAQQALSLAKEYRNRKIVNNQINPVPPAPTNNSPPSLAAIPTSQGTNTAASWSNMSNKDFLAQVNGMQKT